MSGVIHVVLTSSVCVCVRPSYAPGQTDGHTDLNFGLEVEWNNIYVKFVGQGHRSKVMVTRSKNVLWSFQLTVAVL